MCPVFLTGCEVGEFPAIAYQIPKLADIRRRDKASGDKVVLEDVCNPLCVSFVCFLAPNGFYIFGVSKDNVAGGLQNVIDRNPILPGGLHAHIFAVVLRQPICTLAQIARESGKPLALVGCYAVVIGKSNTGNNKGFVDIHSATDGINDFKHNTSPRNNI